MPSRGPEVQARRLGRASARAGPGDEARRMVTRDETRSTGWTVTHVHEPWHTEHGGTPLLSLDHEDAPGGEAGRRGAPRKKRPRKPLPGMRLHQDGSTHEWVPGCQWDLSVTLDEAHRELFRRLGGGRRPAEPSSGRAGGPRDPGALPFPLHRPGLARLVDGGGDRRHEPSDAGTPRLAARGGRVVRRIRRRRGAGRRAPSGPCRTGCPKSGRGPGSRRGRRPTRLCPRGFSRPSFRGSARTSPRSCVCTRNGAWPRITPCGIRARVCRSPRTPIGSIREGHGAGARISGWNLGRVPWPSVSGALPRGWLAHRDWTSPTKSHWPDPRIGRPADRPS